MRFLKKTASWLSKLKTARMVIAAAVGVAFGSPIYAEEGPQKIETMLVGTWQFFAEGDSDRSGDWSETEFMNHSGYKDSGFDLNLKTFIFWMVDDDKDSKISLQEWFNNELGQFQLGDADHDGIMTVTEHEGLEKIENKLFADLKSK
jgi:hypothetical protein